MHERKETTSEIESSSLHPESAHRSMRRRRRFFLSLSLRVSRAATPRDATNFISLELKFDVALSYREQKKRRLCDPHDRTRGLLFCLSVSFPPCVFALAKKTFNPFNLRLFSAHLLSPFSSRSTPR